MGTFGFGTVGFFRALRGESPTPEAIRLHQGAITFGVVLIVLGIGATVLSATSHWFRLRRPASRCPSLHTGSAEASGVV